MTEDTRESLDYIAWMDSRHSVPREDSVYYCHDCESTENLKFVDWIDNYLCPDCLEAELG